MSEDDADEDTQWSAAARIAFNTAGVDLLTAISAHIKFFSSAELGTSWTEKNDLNEVVRHAAAAYADVQFDLTGNYGPFGELQDWDDDDEADDEDEEPQPTSFVSVLQRADYGVLDEELVLDAGRLKFLENRPGESEDNARSEVSHLGAALYELAHADGWDSLDKAPGLTAMGSIIQVIEPSEPIELSDASSDTEEPDAGFSVDGRVLHTEQNQYF